MHAGLGSNTKGHIRSMKPGPLPYETHYVSLQYARPADGLILNSRLLIRERRP